MEYVFNIAPADPERLWPQVSRTLEKRTELLSRRTYPRLWLLNDKICGEADYSEAGRRRRRRFRGWLGLAQYLLGLLFMVPCAMDPEALAVPLGAATVLFGLGMGTLWRTYRRLLWMLGLPLGALLLFGGLMSAELRPVRWIAALLLAAAAAALFSGRGGRVRRFDAAAMKLLRDRQGAIGTLRFSETGVLILDKLPEVPYEKIEYVIAAEDVYQLTYGGRVTILQKSELGGEELPEFERFIAEKADFIRI